MADRQTTNFDFNGFNMLVNSQPAGLKVFLALSLLNDVDYTFHRFSNPLQEDVQSIIADLTDLRTQMKAASAKRREEKQG